MQRMSRAIFDSAIGGDQSLPNHLPAEHALPAGLRAQASEQILLQCLEIENGEELIESLAHDGGFFLALVALPSSRFLVEGKRVAGSAA